MVTAKKTIISQGFSGGPTFSGGGGGFQMRCFIETQITCDFPGGGGSSDPYPPLEPHM